MKTQILHIVFLLVTCSVVGQKNLEYEIVFASLQHFHKIDNFRIVDKPYNYTLDDYLNRFFPDSLNLKSKNFAYLEKRITKWKLKDIVNNTIQKKVQIVGDIDKLPKISPSETPIDTYILMSNPAFSADNKYALISLEFIPNVKFPKSVIPYIMIFKKVDNRWVYVAKFQPYLS